MTSVGEREGGVTEEEKFSHGLNEDEVAGIDVEAIPGMLCDGICPGAPECVTFDHQWHLSEAMFVLIGLVCGLMVFLRMGGINQIDSKVFGSLCVICSAFSLWYLWNFHHLATLARLAAIFETIVKASKKNLAKLKANNAKHREENEKMQVENEALEQENSRLMNTAGLANKTAQELDAVLERVNKLADAQKKMNDCQIELNKSEKAFLRFEKQNQLNVKKNQIKQKMRARFDDVDLDRSGSINTKREKKRLAKLFKQEGLPWDNEFDTDGDGAITKREMVEKLDAHLDMTMTLEYQEKKSN